MKTKTFHSRFYFCLMAAVICCVQHLNAQSRIVTDSTSNRSTSILADPFTQKSNVPASWYFYPDDPELPIATKLPASRIYLLNNHPLPDLNNSSAVQVKRDSKVIIANKMPALIYQGGAALVEGKNISLLHAENATGVSIGHYLIPAPETGVMSGSWKIISDQRPSLLADLKKPRHFRISITTIEPSPGVSRYNFLIYVDGNPLPLELMNQSSIDTYGSRIVVVLKEGQPAGQFRVNGVFTSWN